MALPKLITVSGFDGDYVNGNRVYVTDGIGGYFTTDYYYLFHNGERWSVRSDGYIEIAHSDPCGSDVSPVDVEWGNTPTIGFIELDGDVFDGTLFSFEGYGGSVWYDDDESYYLQWSDTRWELWNNYTQNIYAYTTSTTTSSPSSLVGASWSIASINSNVEYVYQTPVLENAEISISTPAELYAIGMNSYTKSGNYLQTGTIDAGVYPYNEGAGFDPIGTSTVRFTGSFNGNNFEIQNLYINRPSSNGVGMFGYTSATCVLKNIKIRSCMLTGVSSVGALVGETSGGYFTNCSSTGTVSGSGWNIGGLIGKLSSGVIDKSWSSAAATCTGANRTQLGGLFGSLEGWNGQTRCADCYAMGRVTGAATTDAVGGFAGNISSTPQVSRCYASGLATGRNNVGQFSGNESSGPPVITACYWMSDDAGSTSRHGTRLSTTQAKDRANYAGWNFRTLWDMDVTGTIFSGYPYLNVRRAASSYPGLYQSVYRKR